MMVKGNTENGEGELISKRIGNIGQKESTECLALKKMFEPGIGGRCF